jgi:hypothetical protein
MRESIKESQERNWIGKSVGAMIRSKSLQSDTACLQNWSIYYKTHTILV